MRSFGLWVRVAILASVAAHAAAAPVAFDNLGPGDTYGNSGWWVGTIGSRTTRFATSFVPELSGEVAGLVAGLRSNYGGASTFTLSIRLDAGGPTGALLWQDVFPDGLLSGFGSVLELAIDGPVIAAGTTYWVVVETAAPTFYTWQANVTGDAGEIALDRDGAGWSTVQTQARGALRVVLVPEPGTAGLLAFGMLLLAARGRRRPPGLRRRVRYPAAP